MPRRARQFETEVIRMINERLTGSWTLTNVRTGASVPGTVPGSVYYDLLAGGLMEDPYWRDNELKALKVIDDDFEYHTVFDAPKALLSEEHIVLRFDGIDTVADISLNGTPLGHVENMHRIWEFEVKGALRAENNELSVILRSPTKFVADAYERDPIGGQEDAMRGFPHLRKAHCMFGWDWGPRLPDAGIWRDVSLLGWTRARFENVYVTQKHENGNVSLRLETEAELSDYTVTDLSPESGLSLRVTVTDPDGKTSVAAEGAAALGDIVIPSPRLWWPNGYGSQPLYTVRAELLCGGTVLDTWERRIGLRTMTVRREKDEWGESFCHEVNGVRIFAMGADYIPEDNILPRVTPERTRRLLEDAAAAHHNCIRVWGGGHYPSDTFYDICDELGLVVWQDFMFACAVYHLTEDFEANITAEFVDNVKRLRHHASLGLWCGNNEMEMFVKSGNWVNSPKELSDYIKMYEYIIPKVLKQYDPNTFYWPASPSSGGGFDEPNDENRGDVHYWDVWHGSKPFTEYRKFFFRYVSEFGFQSFPSLATCETFTIPEDRNIFSYVMEKHQRNAAANGKIMNYMEQTYLYPTGFDTAIYASQLMQADAIRYGVEHFRRNRGRCMGAVVWQLNDCWPVASWSSIDYFGRWKALHYSEKRFFAPVLLSCEEESVLAQDVNPNAQPYEVKKSIRLNVANETTSPARVEVRWALRDAGGNVLREGRKDVEAAPLSSVWLEREDMQGADLYTNYVSYDCYADGKLISGGTVLFVPPKQFRFEDPHLTVSLEGDEIVVRANAYARAVEIRNETDDLVLEDNYFDMNAGERRVKILRGEPTGLRVRSVYDIR